MICYDKLDKKEIQERERLGIAAIVSAYICKWGGAYEEHSDFMIEFADNDIINICKAIFASQIFDTAFNMFCDEDFEYYNDFCDTGLCDMVLYTFSEREDDNTMTPTDFTYSLPEGLSIFNETWLGYYGEHFDYLHNSFAKATHDLLEYDFENYQEAFCNNNLE